MLVSHRKRFIFTKTVKTAGTSVESYFEPYCMRAGEWAASDSRSEYVSEAGIIGFRGMVPGNVTWYNHLSAQRIRDLIGPATWQDYFKFTVVRNPFEKLVSAYFMLRELIPPDWRQGKTEIERFRCWIAKGGDINDQDKYLIDGKECVDSYIRFEQLPEGIEQVCQRLTIPFEPERIPHFKKGNRPVDVSVRAFFDRDTRKAVQERHAWEIEKFGYRLPA
ncbi:MAG: sulfotransferase family 2 domain-containing protein [Gemmataceae bacterium]